MKEMSVKQRLTSVLLLELPQIQISDDEDDIHPNIDTPSLFRWRHQARVERMEQEQKEKAAIEAKKAANAQKMQQVKEKLKKEEAVDELKMSLKELELEAATLRKVEEDLRKKEKKTPWNVDTICKSGVSKTVINKVEPREDLNSLPDEEREKRAKEFVAAHEKDIKKFGMLRRYEDSRQFLLDNSHLVSEHTANFLVIWCINLEIEEKTELMSHVAHQCICLQYIFDLSKQLDVDPRSCVSSFFTRLPNADAEYKVQFDSEVDAFRGRIKKRAAEKVAEAVAEAEEEERQQRLGPGGLDPVEVFESLPEVLQKCFQSRDVKALQEAILQLPEDEARLHMKRCVDSGLWLPEGDKGTAAAEKEEEVTEKGDSCSGGEGPAAEESTKTSLPCASASKT